MKALACLLAAALAAASLAAKHALLIGIDEYKDRDGISRLAGAENDVDGIASALEQSAGFPKANIETLKGLQATRLAIVEALERLQKRSKPGDVVFFSFSGHGFQPGPSAFLVPYDCRAGSDALIQNSSLPATEAARMLGQVPADLLIASFDMCRNDPRASRSGSRNSMSEAMARDLRIAADRPANQGPQRVVTMFAASAGQRSWEMPEERRGYFSWHLEQGLRGDAARESGEITISSLSEYLESRVLAAVQRERGVEQRPDVVPIGSQVLSFVLARTVPVRPAPVPSPIVLDYSAEPYAEETPDLLGAVSPDGSTLAGLSLGSTIRLWNAQTRGLKLELQGDSNMVLSVAFSPDGSTLASRILGTTIRLWDVRTGSLKGELEGDSDTVFDIAFSPDGSTLASGSMDHIVRLWDVRTGELKQKLKGHSNSVVSVAFSPDGSTLASGSSDKIIRLWDARTGALKRELKGHSESVGSVAFSPDGSTLASGSYEGAIRLWDTRTGEFKQELKGDSHTVFAIAFSPDGSALASGSYKGAIRLWGARTGELLHSIPTGSSVHAVTFGPDGALYADNRRFTFPRK